MVTGKGVHVAKVALQKVAVRVGLAQQDGNNASLSKQHDAGIVCAVRGAEVSSSTSTGHVLVISKALACSAFQESGCLKMCQTVLFAKTGEAADW